MSHRAASTMSIRRRRCFANQEEEEEQQLGASSCSSRRLSAVVNPDVLHDVTFFVSDEFARRRPARRHSIAITPRSARFPPAIPQPMPLPSNRAFSEEIPKADLNALEGWTQIEALLEEDLLEEPLDEAKQEPSLSSSSSSPSTNLWFYVFGLFAGYLLSSFGLQKLNGLRPGCGQVVALMQYLATIAEKAPRARSFLYSPVIPMYWHCTFVCLMFLSMKLGNSSLAMGLPFGLYLVIKNTNLAWSLMLGISTGRCFTTAQILSIGLVTAGIFVCVLAQDNDKDVAIENEDENKINAGLFWFSAVLCAASTFCMAALGSLQELIFARYKNKGLQEASEALFFTHLLGLPLFAMGGGIDKMQDDILHLWHNPGTAISMLLLNILFTLVVKQCFVHLLEKGACVTATLTLTVARMSGVIVSEVQEGTSPPSFWIGALLVALGSVSYATGGRFPRTYNG